MSNLVFIEPNKIGAVPFTTSDVIAEYSQISHHAVQQMISKHATVLRSFGVIAFEMRKPPKGSKGGKPETIYHLTEEQASLLITFLKNTEPVIRFKKELVRQFYAMRTELYKRQALREALKPIRRELTDVIQEIDHSKWDYKLYTDLAYKLVTGMNAAQLRKDRNAPKDSTAIEYMTSDEIERVAGLTHKIGVLLEMGLDYYQIKALLVNRQMLGRLA
jgi:phage regulator Rha-like protein